MPITFGMSSDGSPSVASSTIQRRVHAAASAEPTHACNGPFDFNFGPGSRCWGVAVMSGCVLC